MEGVQGRDFNQIRPLNIKLSVSLSFSGSCIASLGNTKVKCLVNLPKPSNKKIFGDSGYMNLEIKSNSSVHSSKTLDILRTSILEVFERHIIFKDYPRQVIDAFLIIQNDDGGLLSASLMGLCLALIDCGIHVSDIISACSLVRISKQTYL
ncbi:3' exoribonuclease domain 1 containing protein [Theileria equi strain WA]|uniref:3' exoribonuclease domain 1 containing protein n=1 Tax=Theileria equi strain WA TaxID=1537102 RepID=L1LFM0_THEEQ|nr:3' exoribonuclease domain 1 containing protein [Theileria equi strain WA]EKX74227.1 3' exoribonuclease domain 1 containing protein [Theileria equi strain WA]|eukprot:XP_004833679.1 3' exoribonuclease domain 1 containing protein [Theileria equi strain WA]